MRHALAGSVLLLLTGVMLGIVFAPYVYHGCGR